MVRYERRKQSRTSPSPIERCVVFSQGRASRHEGSIAGLTAAPCDLQEKCSQGSEPFRTVLYTLGLVPQPSQILETCPARCATAYGWRRLGCWASSQLAGLVPSSRQRSRKDNATRLPQQPGSLSEDTPGTRRSSLSVLSSYGFSALSLFSETRSSWYSLPPFHIARSTARILPCVVRRA